MTWKYFIEKYHLFTQNLKICSMLENSNYELNIQYHTSRTVAARYEFEDNGCITKTMTILNGKGMFLWLQLLTLS
jgi:hypothetical protein